MNQTPVTVLLVNHNGRDDTLRCIASLEAGQTRPTSILVIDNSTDPSRSCTTIPPTTVPVRVLVTENRGFGAACNAGISMLDSEPDGLVWILNNDTVVEPDCLQLLVASLNSGRCEIAVPTIVDATSRMVWYAGGHWDQRWGWTVHHQWGKPEEQVASDGYTELITGCSFLTRRSTFVSLGGFDESLFMYCEDVEMSLRGAKAGVRALHAAEATVRHFPGSSTGGEADGPSATTLFYTLRNRLWLLRRRQVKKYPAILLTPVIAVREALGSLRGSQNRPQRVKAVARGTFVGICGRVPAPRLLDGKTAVE